MTQLYTSMADVKLALANGAPPAYVAIAGAWRDRLDPDHLLGAGALLEDDTRGLKCPFRYCDRWCHSLSNHVWMAHHVRADELKAAIGLPSTMSMLSASAHERYSRAQRAVVASGRSGIYKSIRLRRRESRAERAKYRPRTVGLSVAARNWRLTCRAQLRQQLVKVADEHWAVELTVLNAIELLGHATFKRIVRAFGSWNQAKRDANLDARYRYAFRLSLAQAVDAFVQFRRAHGHWPSADDAGRGHYAPAIPGYNSVRRVTGSRSWADALRVIQREAKRRTPRLRLVA